MWWSAVAAALSASLALAVGACAPSAVAEPTWVDDVRPILEANCLRCHSSPAIGGAPPSFRLDVYDDVQVSAEASVRGAGAMAEMIAARANLLGDMPPDFPLADDQRETLQNWYDVANPITEPGKPASADGSVFLPARGSRSGNQPPTLTLLGELTASGDYVPIRYEAGDADGDLVRGELRVDGCDTTRNLVGEVWSGRGQLRWDVGVLAPGTHSLYACLSDSLEPIEVEVGQIDVQHPDTAPSIDSVSLRIDDVLGDGASPHGFEVSGSFGPDTTVSAVAVRGDEEIDVDSGPAGALSASLEWDTTELTAAATWRLRITATDGDQTRIRDFGPFIVSHGDTALTYDDDVEPILKQHCFSCCHGGVALDGQTRVPGLTQNWGSEVEVSFQRALIWRRVVQRHEMPPPSARAVAVDCEGPLTVDDLATLSEWLLRAPEAPL